MELRHLRYFIAVADERQLNRAAARLRVAPSALSRQLRDLEAELGVALFERLPRGLELTEAGRAYLSHARRTLDAADEGARAARAAGRQITGRLRIGLPDWGNRAALIRCGLDSLRRAHPGITVEFDPVPWVMQEGAVRARAIDVGFSAGGLQGEYGDDIAAEWIAPELGNSAIISASHPAAARPTITLADVRDLPLLLPPREVHPVLYDRTVATVRRCGGFEPRVHSGALSAMAATMAVTAGAGWLICFESLGAMLPPGTVLRRLEDVSENLGFFALRRRDDERPHVLAFVEHVRAAFAADARGPDASSSDAPGPDRAGA